MEGNVWISLITYYFLKISLLDLNERHQDGTLTYISGGSKGGAEAPLPPPPPPPVILHTCIYSFHLVLFN